LLFDLARSLPRFWLREAPGIYARSGVKTSVAEKAAVGWLPCWGLRQWGVDGTRNFSVANPLLGCGTCPRGSTGRVEPLKRSFSEITSDLEALKGALIDMTPTDIDQSASAAMALEISAIRLHLKRLEYERQAVDDRKQSARRN
jgi:hypothetical protein